MTANMDAAPGTDSLTNLVYKECWGVLGDSLTEIAQAVLNGDKTHPLSKNFAYGVWQ